MCADAMCVLHVCVVTKASNMCGCVCVSADLTAAQVAQRFSTMRGRLTQGLTNWAANNPSQHR